MTSITTKAGAEVPELVFHPSMFLDKTIALYGPSKTGKTVIVKNIMKTLRNHIEQILVVAPTEPTNKSYDGFVNSALIHYRMGIPDPNDKRDTEAKQRLRFLETVWSRQEMMAAIYTRANNIKVLERLFNRIKHGDRKEGNKYLSSLERKRERVAEKMKDLDEGRRDQKIKEIDEKFMKMKVLLYKKFLSLHVDRLWSNEDLTEDEQWSLQYLHFNPRLLLIFDDCAAELKPYFTKDIFRKLFYQNRHSFITVIMCFQDDTDLNPNLRKNAFISMFTTAQVCRTFFARNKYPKEEQNYVDEVSKDVYKGHRKMAYIREDDRGLNYYHVTCAYPKPFMFGSDALQELCNKVSTKGVTMDKENPFYDKFKI